MTGLDSVPFHSLDIVTKRTGNEYVLVPVTNNIADMDSVYTLNETGAFIWEQIDGKKNLKEIIEALISEYDISGEEAKSDVLEFMENLANYLIIT
ncbi:MAG TPA: PqqD family protein [Bacteroidales bacterium]|nr:PqqD family protein [Bacteroidales bacterium]